MINIKKESFYLMLLLIIDFLLEFSVIHKIRIALNLSGISGLFFYKVCSFIILLCLNYLLTKQSVFFKFTPSANIIKALAIIPVIFLIFFLAGSKRLPEALIVGTVAAVPEEYLFRGILLGKMLKLFSFKSKDKNMSILFSILISSLLFSLIHLTNLSDQSLISTICQMIQVFGMGILLAVVYIKSGSIVFPMSIHFFIDSLSTLFWGYSNSSPGTTSYSIVSAIMWMFIYIGISVIVMSNDYDNKLLQHYRTI
ncbi:CPBP family intramembrane glutamic endopeptidase [Liquorilactobacillus aquaticus]|uniref:CPBP family intramembrane glutamic endopeptidase n=1 Tax=Liquorilactobacillus aquaticus TaxID=392566 RepID=UPI00070C45DC|nr:CPBP family intramembrane glutamic endopeptidase [Liquorilactobacillus aquaticus]